MSEKELTELTKILVRNWKTFIFHCTKCDHEWESAYENDSKKCDWCGAPGKKISGP